MPRPLARPLAVATALLLLTPSFGWADVTVLDDFEDVSDWRNLTAETARESDGAPLGVDISCEAPGLGAVIPTSHVDLAAAGTGAATVTVSIPASVWTGAPYATHDVAIVVTAGGSGREEWPALVANPGPHLRLVDTTGESHVSPQVVLDFTDWRELSYELAGWDHWSGNDDGVIDLPLGNLVVQVGHEAGGAATGVVLADDWALTFPSSGTRVVEDFEVLVAREQVWTLGQPATTYVVGEGIGPDLRVPVPYAMLRRQGVDVDFDVLHDPHGTAGPNATAFERLAPSARDHQGYHVAGATFDDVLLLAGGIPAGTTRQYGAWESEAALCWLRREAGALRRLALVDGSHVADDGLAIFTALHPMAEVALSISGGTVVIEALSGDLDGARLHAPATQAVMSVAPAGPSSTFTAASSPLHRAALAIQAPAGIAVSNSQMGAVAGQSKPETQPTHTPA